MDNCYNDIIKPLLDLADSLPALLKDTPIKIPRIASCGMQSHGKSSTLESITHISLPKGDGTVTICPIKISLRNAKNKEYARIKFEEDKEEKYETITLDEISQKIMEYQNKLKKENNVGENEIKLFDKVIQVEVNRKNAPNLTLYDMPGINFKEDIKNESEAINEKFLKEEETTVLLVISGSEEVTNCYATEWMKIIPDYKKRFNAIITKADLLIEKNIEVYLEQLKSLKLENPPSLLVNKFGKYNKLSYEEMEKEELKLINKIEGINNYPNINKGIQALIAQLIEIQRKDLLTTFSDIVMKIKREIVNNQKILKNYPSKCETKEKFFEILGECLKKFKDKIKSKKEILKCKEDGTPESNLLNYEIQLKFRKHLKNVKNKINKLLDLSFSNQLTFNTIQFNSSNISILENNSIFGKLLKPKVEEILSDFELIINEIFDYMMNNINPIIKESFWEFQNLEKKVSKLYSKYSSNQKEKMMKFYEQIYYLETENIYTFNTSLIDKVNNLNKQINYILFGEKKKTNEIIPKIVEKSINTFINTNPSNQLNSIKLEEENFYEVPSDNDENEDNKEEKKSEVKKEEKKEDEKIKNEVNDPLKTINELTSEINNNNKIGEIVKEKYKKSSELKKSEIINVYNYGKEKKVRQFDHDEFSGRIKVAYGPSDIDTFYERLIDENIIKLNEDSKNEFIPGFQYIEKKKLAEFQKLIYNGDIQMKAANIVTKMIAYLEVMLNRNLDIFYLSIQKYLYDNLTDDIMIDHIRDKIHLLDFEKCQKLVEINPDYNKKRDECLNSIKNLKEALKSISSLKNMDNIISFNINDEEEKEEEEDEDEDEKNINNNKDN